jgi:hypothetical protein
MGASRHAVHLLRARGVGMPLYRATIRFGAPKQQYHVLDLSANSLREAMRLAAEQYPEAAAQDADLVEIRLQADPDQREFGPE